jgi:hypothetical protein
LEPQIDMTIEIPLWLNKNERSEHVAIVDGEDAPTVLRVKKWFLHTVARSRTFYARTNRKLWMHHMIAGRISGFEVDHKNGNGLDNRFDNLRHVTHSENMIAANSRQPFNRRFGTGINRKIKTLSTGEKVCYWYHKPTRTRLPEYPGHPAFENALATKSPDR